MNKKIIICLILLYLLSRIFFINARDVFFDSGEYLNLLANSNYLIAIINGHFPPHEGYIILFWPIFQSAKILHLNPAYSVVMGQIILSMLTVYCFYQFLVYLSDKKTALLGSVIASLIPLFWIINVTVMMENAYAAFFFLSLLFLTRYLSQKKQKHQLHISLFFFGLCFITQPILVIWVPFLIFLVYYKNIKKLREYVIWLVTYFIATVLLNVTFLTLIIHSSWSDIFYLLYDSKTNEFESVGLSISSLLVFCRDFIIPFLRNNTSLIVILGFIGLYTVFKSNKKLSFLSFLWIAPAVYANQWWDSLLMGRHSLIASFGLAFLVAYLIRKKPVISAVIIMYLLIVAVPAMFLLRGNIPYIEEEAFVKTLPKNSTIIESHFALPQVKEDKGYKILEVNTPSMSNINIEEDVNASLKAHQPVYISSAAISDPYGLYTGPYLHTLSLSYAHGFQLDPLLRSYSLKTYKVLNQKDNLIIYKIVAIKKSPYPPVPDMINSYRRLDYYDPLWWAYRGGLSFLPKKP